MIHKRVGAMFVALLVLATAPRATAQDATGSVQVRSEAGLAVTLDGKAAGSTSAEQKGVLLEVAPGKHVLRFEKASCEPKEASVMVKAGATVELKVGGFTCKPTEPAPAKAAPAAASSTAAAKPAPPPAAAAAKASPAPAPATTKPQTRPGALKGATRDPALASDSQAKSEPAGSGEVTVVFWVNGTLGEGRSVSVWRQGEGGAKGELLSECLAGPSCMDTKPNLLPAGHHRLRVSFRHSSGEGGEAKQLFAHDIGLDLKAAAGQRILVLVSYGGDKPEKCTASLMEATQGVQVTPGKGDGSRPAQD